MDKFMAGQERLTKAMDLLAMSIQNLINIKQPIGTGQGSSLKTRDEAILENNPNTLGRENVEASYKEYMAFPKEIREAMSFTKFMELDGGRSRPTPRHAQPRSETEQKNFQVVLADEEVEKEGQGKIGFQHE
ncbi:hypothetical protein KI387_037979, partial [Taxus chinensis]